MDGALIVALVATLGTTYQWQSTSDRQPSAVSTASATSEQSAPEQSILKPHTVRQQITGGVPVAGPDAAGAFRQSFQNLSKNTAAGIEQGFQQATQQVGNNLQQGAQQAAQSLAQQSNGWINNNTQRQTIAGEVAKVPEKLGDALQNTVKAFEGTAQNLKERVRGALPSQTNSNFGQQTAQQNLPNQNLAGQNLAGQNFGSQNQGSAQPGSGFQPYSYNQSNTAQQPSSGNFGGNDQSILAQQNNSQQNGGQQNGGTQNNSNGYDWRNDPKYNTSATPPANPNSNFGNDSNNGFGDNGFSTTANNQGPQFGQPAQQQPQQNSNNFGGSNLANQNNAQNGGGNFNTNGLEPVNPWLGNGGSGNSVQTNNQPTNPNDQFNYPNGGFAGQPTNGQQYNQPQTPQQPAKTNQWDNWPVTQPNNQYAVNQTPQQTTAAYPNNTNIDPATGQPYYAQPGLPPLDANNPYNYNNGQYANGGGLPTSQVTDNQTDPTKQPWEKLVLATLVCLGSLSGNLFLGYSYLDARNKYRSVLRRTGRVFGRGGMEDV